MTISLARAVVGQGPTVVLIHGHPFDRSMWHPQLAALQDRFRLIAPDLRGYGESPATPGLVGMEELGADVWALLAELAIQETAVVGLSMGGLVAMEMAIAQPERIWGLGLVATTAQAVTDGERRERLAVADKVEALGMQPLVKLMAPRLFGGLVDEPTIARVQEMMSANNPRGAAAALRGRTERPDYRPQLRKLDIPSFVCTGTSDAWSTPQVTAELVGCLRKPRTTTLADVGHLPNLEAPELFNVELADFLSEAWAARN